MKKILFIAVSAGILLSCSKQDTPEIGITNGENTVTLSIKQNALSKSIDNQKENTEYAVIGSAKLFFIDDSDNSIYQRDLTSAEILSLANTSSTPGNNSVTITGVPNTATTLYFMANIKTTDGNTYPVIDGTSSADARLRIDRLQVDDTHAPMSGRSAAFVSTANPHVFTASVTLTPIVARLEIGQVTCQNQNGAGQPAISADITGYKLAGVFINNVRQNVLLSGLPYLVGSPIDIKSQSGWAAGWANYFATGNSVFPYYAGGSPAAPSDWTANAMVNYCNPTGNIGLTFYPDATNGATSTAPILPPNKAWAYQVCPSATFVIGSPADVPHIILKITDVEYSSNPLGNTTKYITVTKYKDNSGNPINEFQRGNVYRISNLIFTHNEATNQPYEENISVTATVTVAPWVLNNINPDWN